MNKRFLISSIVVIGLLTSSVGIMIWWASISNENITTDYVEIREYEGQDLSSIKSFGENSIKGTQFVDNETYKLAIKGLVRNQRWKNN